MHCLSEASYVFYVKKNCLICPKRSTGINLKSSFWRKPTKKYPRKARVFNKFSYYGLRPPP
ncbi:MAG: hypothetical protein ACD_72C00295G0002 [uncultured bacterium]|nr:MAG: hypothetical protein ACD_72C00295G0002 [uncultured bacterium]